MIYETINTEGRMAKVHVKSQFDSDDQICVNKTTYEVILRIKVDDKYTNVNVLLTKKGFAECTNFSIFEGEQSIAEGESSQMAIMPRKPSKPTRLENEIKEVCTLPNKIINTKPVNSVLCKVVNALSPSEIWVQDIIDSENFYQEFQTQFSARYRKLISNENDNMDEYVLDNPDEWMPGDYCVKMSQRRIDFYRARIVEKKSNGKYKVICLDNGLYDENVDPRQLCRLIDEFNNKPEYKAKKCYLAGVEPTGTTNGRWSSLSQNYTTETLSDQFVHVVFLSDRRNAEDAWEVNIYVDAKKKKNPSEPKIAQTSTISSIAASIVAPETNFANNEEFIRFADLLNSKGLAFLVEKKHPFEKLLAKLSTANNQN